MASQEKESGMCEGGKGGGILWGTGLGFRIRGQSFLVSRIGGKYLFVL